MNKIRFGLLGPGNIAGVFASAIKTCDNAELVAVASHDINKAQAFAQKYNVDKAYNSYEQLLNDKNIDAIYISVINTNHMKVIEKCIKYNKPILCEKPLVLNEKDIIKIEDLQKVNNVLIMEALWTNFLPVTQKTKQWISEKKIGDVESMEVSFCFENHDYNGRLYQKKMGGGALFDVGVYTLSYTMFLIDSDLSFQSSQLEYAKTGVDKKGKTTLTFNNGVKAICKYSISYKEDDGAMITGTNGSIKIKNFWRGNKCTCFDIDGNVVEEFVDNEELGFHHEIKHFADLVIMNKKNSNIMPLSKSKKCAHLFDEILNN